MAVAAMSVSFRFEDNDRGYKERVRSADSNGGGEGEECRRETERRETDNLRRTEKAVEMW